MYPVDKKDNLIFMNLLKKLSKKTQHKIIILIVVILFATLYQTHVDGMWSINALKAKCNIFYITQSLKNDPENQDLLISLGVNHYILKDLNQSLEAYSQATQVNPDGFIAWNNIGNIQRDLLNFWEAEKAYKQAIEINPSYIPAYINLVDLYVIWPIDEAGEKKEQQIISLLQKGIEANPENSQLQEVLKAYISANK